MTRSADGSPRAARQRRRRRRLLPRPDCGPAVRSSSSAPVLERRSEADALRTWQVRQHLGKAPVPRSAARPPGVPRPSPVGPSEGAPGGEEETPFVGLRLLARQLGLCAEGVPAGPPGSLSIKVAKAGPPLTAATALPGGEKPQVRLQV